jgi:hypothetical protein
MNPDQYNHVFRTLFGMPPDKSDKPLCGADLPDSWDFPGYERPACPTCQEIAGRIT